tara:strand:+ start:2095 stop:4065 length:1971 start_codon:yes stop_codon:yes gene_type:complete
MARRPLYPVTPGETAVDRLLNETLPNIIQQEMQRAERNEAREREEQQFQTRMMYQAQRDDIEDRRNYNRDVAPYLEGLEVAFNNRDSKSAESNLNIYEMYVNDPANAKLIGPDAKSKLTEYKTTLKNLGDANTKAQGFMDTLNDPQASQDDTTAAYKWMLKNKDTYSLTMGTDFSAIMNNKEFMESGRYTGVRILNRSPKMAMDIETLYQNSVGSAIKTYDKAVAPEDLEAYAKYLPENLKSPIVGIGPEKMRRDSLLRQAYEQYGRPQYIAAGQEFFNSFDDLFVSKEGKNLYLDNASETEKNDIFTKLTIARAMANSNSPEFSAKKTGKENERLTKFGNIFLSDSQIDQIESELIQSGIDAKHFAAPKVDDTTFTVDVTDDGDATGDRDDFNLGSNDVRLADESIETRVAKTIELSQRARAILYPRAYGERDENGNIVSATPIERDELLDEKEKALSSIMEEKSYLDGVITKRNLNQDERSRYNEIQKKLSVLRKTRKGRKAIQIFEKGNTEYFLRAEAQKGKYASTLDTAIKELNQQNADNELLRRILQTPGDELVLAGPVERNKSRDTRIKYFRPGATSSLALIFGKVYNRKTLEEVLKFRESNAWIGAYQRKLEKAKERFESNEGLLTDFLLVNSVNEDTKELINQYFIPK